MAGTPRPRAVDEGAGLPRDRASTFRLNPDAEPWGQRCSATPPVGMDILDDVESSNTSRDTCVTESLRTVVVSTPGAGCGVFPSNMESTILQDLRESQRLADAVGEQLAKPSEQCRIVGRSYRDEDDVSKPIGRGVATIDSNGLMRGPGEIWRPGDPLGGDFNNVRHPFKVFLGGVPHSIKEDELFAYIDEHVGRLLHLKMTLDCRPERYHKGYAFAVFSTQELRDSCVKRRRIIVNGQAVECKEIDPSSSSRIKLQQQQVQLMATQGRVPLFPQSLGGEVPDECKMFFALKGHSSSSIELCDESLKLYFSDYGEVVRASTIRDKLSDLSKGYGFIYFGTSEGPRTALAAGREHIIDGGIRIEVKPFESRKVKPGGVGIYRNEPRRLQRSEQGGAFVDGSFDPSNNVVFPGQYRASMATGFHFVMPAYPAPQPAPWGYMPPPNYVARPTFRTPYDDRERSSSMHDEDREGFTVPDDTRGHYARMMQPPHHQGVMQYGGGYLQDFPAAPPSGAFNYRSMHSYGGRPMQSSAFQPNQTGPVPMSYEQEQRVHMMAGRQPWVSSGFMSRSGELTHEVEMESTSGGDDLT